MLNFLEKLPNIYIVFATFVVLFTGWVLTRSPEMLQLVNIAVGGLMGLAMKSTKPQQTINAERIENADVNLNEDDNAEQSK